MNERGPEIGARIAEARQAAGLSQAQLADILDVTPRMVQHYEKGSTIPYAHFDRLEQLFDVTLGWLMYGENRGGPSYEDLGRMPSADMFADRQDALMAKLEEIAEGVRALLAERRRERA